ncbi:hypothetical protein [Criblamydia sequanensis]|uniref:Uncharacterized protein n=1 Tax=Candidatus Criblamydia sequanensis CRIB-18 TaxID=1437425 RepID=A0A090DWR2_9BACT|nr:hypothetical protein [Criblamydia sequanensis]CDR33284.1 Conserved hypothetical protein [Criblamydia sequanensis CRIB-18]
MLYKKLILSLIFLGACYIADPLFGETRECDNIFFSKAYSEYASQLKQFVRSHPFYESLEPLEKTPFNQEALKLIQLIDGPLTDPKRQFHESFVRSLRNLASLEFQENALSYSFFQDLLRWIYLKADLKKEFHEFIASYLVDHPNLLEAIKITYNKIKAHSNFKKLGHNSKIEDQFFYGNLPFFVAELSNSSKTKLFRLGNPSHNDPSFFGTTYSVLPEFRAFIAFGQNHLYINLMKRVKTEKFLALPLEKLSQESPNFFMATLDKDSSFYWQKAKQFPEKMDFKNFKNLFLDEMLAKEGNFFFSSQFRIEEKRDQLESLINKAHKTFFSARPHLNREERQALIELTYLNLIDYLLELSNPASMNITCRQGMDRGPSLMLLFAYQKKLIDKQELIALLLASPIIIHNRPSHESRIDRFLLSAKYLNQF